MLLFIGEKKEHNTCSMPLSLVVFFEKKKKEVINQKSREN